MGVTKKIPFKKVHVEKNSFQCVVVSLSPRRHDIQTSQGFQCGIAKIVASLAISINRAKLSPLHKSLDVSSNHCFNFEQPVSSSCAYFLPTRKNALDLSTQVMVGYKSTSVIILTR